MGRVWDAREKYMDLVRDGATHPAENLEEAWRELVTALVDVKCVYCEATITYRFDDPVAHMGCVIADESA